MTNETIENIVAEMRLHTRCSAADAFYDVTAWTKLCDRIEAAEKRENDRLRAALRPVLECLGYDVGNSFKAEVTYDENNEEIFGEFFDKDGATVITESEVNSILNSVREAQRIYKEGEAND